MWRVLFHQTGTNWIPQITATHPKPANKTIACIRLRLQCAICCHYTATVKQRGIPWWICWKCWLYVAAARRRRHIANATCDMAHYVKTTPSAKHQVHNILRCRQTKDLVTPQVTRADVYHTSTHALVRI